MAPPLRAELQFCMTLSSKDKFALTLVMAPPVLGVAGDVAAIRHGGQVERASLQEAEWPYRDSVPQWPDVVEARVRRRSGLWST